MDNATARILERRRVALTQQGLDPIRIGLIEAGVGFFTEDTGGSCMALVIPVRFTHESYAEDYQVQAWLNGYGYGPSSPTRVVENEHGLMLEVDVDDVVVIAGEGDGTYYVVRMPRSVWESAEGESRDSHEFDPGNGTVYGVEAAIGLALDLREQEVIHIKIGDAFEYDTDRTWTDEHGAQHVHRCTRLVRVVAVDERSVDYSTVKVIRESGRPDLAGDAGRSRGSLALFAMPLYLARGSMRFVDGEA